MCAVLLIRYGHDTNGQQFVYDELEGAGALQLWATKPEGMPGYLVSLGRRKACDLGSDWHGVLNNIQSPGPFSVWVNSFSYLGLSRNKKITVHKQRQHLIFFCSTSWVLHNTIMQNDFAFHAPNVLTCLGPSQEGKFHSTIARMRFWCQKQYVFAT